MLTERLLTIEAWLLLGISRGLVLLAPFRRVAGWMEHGVGPASALSPDQAEQAQQIGVVIQKVSRLTPWDSNCLAQAVAGYWMLRRRGIAATLYLGVKKQYHVMEAHAWLKAGDMIVTGEAGHTSYATISSFGAKPL